MKKISIWFPAAVITLILSSLTVSAEPAKNPPPHLYEQNTMSILWFQNAGEAKALYYQGYNIGKLRLDEILRKKQYNRSLKPAIVLDIDETVLDNSPYQASFVVNRNGDPFNWSNWFDRAEAKLLPGALEFLQYADAKGVEIYYISNRKETQKAATIKNLQHVGAPQADARHVLLQQENENGKETRRRHVAKTHDILLLFGDNLGDFSGFDGLTDTGRVDTVNKMKEEFGKKLIVFPNPMYGDWEGAIYDFDMKKSWKDIERIRKEHLNSIEP
ncbi:5'-nucleotidase, lipoprotein e(P4) family [Neobacillus mesonae]|uniref:5'-nucleotidase, lipoprotein e(P4) family n=1 Tax=Neobacillus mesonae TaxID=1193713 RepID=A0A3Q9QTE1_9BACI|nr:5'-nucleotidase, lipoprotein e(P4) family [Neobacillus mesonae]AZU61134.1 5'-nucleotidase, lipoprotein e(P4) family [Neobacillus mesonae]